MDFSSMANMKLTDFENLGKIEYDKGFKAALLTVIKVVNNRICFDYNADGTCEHQVCFSNAELVEGLESALRNLD